MCVSVEFFFWFVFVFFVVGGCGFFKVVFCGFFFRGFLFLEVFVFFFFVDCGRIRGSVLCDCFNCV